MPLSDSLGSQFDGSLLVNNDESGASKLRFLVVDDIRSCRRMLTHALSKRLGHEVDEAADGAEAFRKVVKSLTRGRPYDAVFMDAHMPVMDGSVAAKAMTKVGFEGEIICVTGLADDVLDGVGQPVFPHFHAVVAKPMEYEKIVEIVQRECGVFTISLTLLDDSSCVQVLTNAEPPLSPNRWNRRRFIRKR